MTAPRLVTPATLSLIAAMNQSEVSVFRRPEFALIPTGDELIMPGEEARSASIVASNIFGIKACLEANGARVRLLPIARDRAASLRFALETASGSDMIVTVGGASEGDHDLVRPVAGELGLEASFYKVAMRPGKPLAAGRLAGTPLVGLPGNAVSALVCCLVFLVPAVRAMLGLGRFPLGRQKGVLASGLAPNGMREHYMRAERSPETGRLDVFNRQDSSLVRLFDRADALVVRPPDDPAREIGEVVEYLDLRKNWLDTKHEQLQNLN